MHESDPILVRMRGKPRSVPSRRARGQLAGLLLLGALLGAVATAPGQDAGPARIAAVALFADGAVLDIDGRRRRLEVGGTSPEGVTLVAADSRGAEIRVGGELRTLTLDGAISGAPRPAGRVLRLAPQADGHFYADGTVNGTAVRFVVDTGASSIALNRETARRVGLLYRVDGVPGQVETAGGLVPAYRVTLDRVTVGSIEQTRVPAVVVDGEYPSVALLGQAFLNRLDLQRSGLLLELRER